MVLACLIAQKVGLLDRLQGGFIQLRCLVYFTKDFDLQHLRSGDGIDGNASARN